MHLTRVFKPEKAQKPSLPAPRDVSGIALFMVMAAIGVLSILVSEFAYIAQINSRMAYDSLDQVKAHYLAKSGLKLSLLRLKAYQQLKSTMGGSATGGASAGAASNPLSGAIPKAVLEKIWSFPFFYPLPSIPDMTVSQKDQIQDFQKTSNLEGKYSAIIESESSKYNLNLLLAQFVPTPAPSPAPSAAPSASPSPAPSFDPELARKSLHDYLQDLMTAKYDSDEDFAREYRDFKVDDLVTYLSLWADRTYDSGVGYPSDSALPKKAPFYSITELHMIPTVDDDLYRLISEGITVSRTPGININTMQEPTLRALVPQISKDETADFFKYRDDPDADHLFKTEQEFWDYITKSVASFRGDKAQTDRLREGLIQRNIRLVTDETEFKITVQANMNQAVRTLEAWVTLTGSGSPSGNSSPSGASSTGKPGTGFTPNPAPQGAPFSAGGTSQPNVPDSGLKINFMRFL